MPREVFAQAVECLLWLTVCAAVYFLFYLYFSY